MRLVLASQSPRRKELLNHLGVSFDVIAADIDETQRPAESATEYVQRMAREKAAAVLHRLRSGFFAVLSADTSVIVDGEVFQKPVDEVDAKRMLQRLSGKTHEVKTAVYLAQVSDLVEVGYQTCVASARVTFVDLSSEMIDWYVSSKEGSDKAGGYASQLTASAFISRIEGSHTAVIGLPLAETAAMLMHAKIPLGWSTAK